MTTRSRDHHHTSSNNTSSGVPAGAIGKEVVLNFDPRWAEKIEVDNISIQVLMGNTVSSGLRLNAGAESIKATSRDRRKSTASTWEQQLLLRLANQLSQIEELIQAIEEQVVLLRSQAQQFREQSLKFFERADIIEDLLAEGLDEQERHQAITLLQEAGHQGDLGTLDQSDLAALLALQLREDRNHGAASFQKGDRCDSSAEKLLQELADRKLEAEELRKELALVSDDDDYHAERLSQACLRLKEDLLAITPSSSDTTALREGVADEKHKAARDEDYAFDADAEIGTLDLGAIAPHQKF